MKYGGPTAAKVNGIWRYVYRAIDRHGQVIDVWSLHVATRSRRGGSSTALEMLKATPCKVVTPVRSTVDRCSRKRFEAFVRYTAV